MKFIFAPICLFATLFCSAHATENIESPDGQIRVQFSVVHGVPVYSVRRKGKILIRPSKLGFEFKSGGEFKDVKLFAIARRSEDAVYSLPIGKASEIRDRFNEATFDLREAVTSGRRLVIDFRVYDDGVGFRYVIPEQDAVKNFVITRELTEYRVGTNTTLHGLPLPFNSSYEGYYKSGKLKSFGEEDTIVLPLLMRVNGQYIGLTEAALTDFAGMYVARVGDRLETRLAPSLSDPETKVVGSAPFSSPWRVLLLGDSPGRLLQNDLIYNLNEPAKFDPSWVQLGKVQFPWWNSYTRPNDDPSRPSGVNTWTYERYIDFAAANGIEFHSLDGLDQAWYGGPVDPYAGADVTRGASNVDVPAILAHGRALGVRTRLWLHVGGLLKRDLDEVFGVYESWGVAGVMIDFVNRDDQEMVRFYTRAIQAAARHHLTINFHGIWKPTGVERTYPNLLNHEAVMNTEYNKWNEHGCPPEHEMMFTFVRMMAGPLDTHQGSFRPVRPDLFKPEPGATRSQGTLARQLAQYIVYENHLPMLVDYPEAYLAHPREFKFVTEVPVTWDETRVLAEDFPRFIVIARRSGAKWYIGAMGDRSPHAFTVPMNFLGTGRFRIESFADGKVNDSAAFAGAIVTRASRLAVRMSGGGGFAARITLE